MISNFAFVFAFERSIEIDGEVGALIDQKRIVAQNHKDNYGRRPAKYRLNTFETTRRSAMFARKCILFAGSDDDDLMRIGLTHAVNVYE